MNQPTKDEILDEVERLDREASPKPWRQCCVEDGCGGGMVWADDPENPVTIAQADHGNERANGGLVAYFRNHTPALAAEVRRLRRELELAELQWQDDSTRFAKEREGLRAQIEDRRSRYRELAREAGYTGDTAEHRDVMTWASDQKTLVASLRARADVPYRPGLPSVEQVRAHESKGGAWQGRCRCDAPGGPVVVGWFRDLQRPGEYQFTARTMLTDSAESAMEFRPVTPDGTPIPWTEVDQ